MLQSFREQKKALLKIESERRGFGQVKRARTEIITEELPSLEPDDFDFLRQLCPLLQIFNRETEKVWNF
jgi:hypothetical protein